MSDFCPHGYSHEQVKDDYCTKCLRAQLSSTEKELRLIKTAFDIVHDHYLSLEEQANIVGLNMDSDLRDRVRFFGGRMRHLRKSFQPSDK